MNDNFKKQIQEISDISEISQIFKQSTQLKESIEHFSNHSFSPELSKEPNSIPICFNKKGDTIYLVGDYKTKEADNSSVVEVILDAIENSLLESAHVLQGRGLFVGLIEACSVNSLGFDITSDSEISEKEFLYNEDNGSILISVNSKQEGKFVDYIYNSHVEITLLGHVTKGELRVDEESLGYINEYIE